MAENIQLKKGPPSEPSKDFALLREKGMEIIRQLAADTWTDHNLTDPGITSLEVLAYAITELGHKTNFDIKDLLASSPAAKQSSILPASTALSSHPITADDFRKVLIDQEGIRNAWVQAQTYYTPAFSYEARQKQFCMGTAGEIRVKPKGLHEVLLEFDNDQDLGDLNQSIFSRTFEIDIYEKKSITVEIGLPFLDDPDMELWREPLNFSRIVGENELDGKIQLIEASGGIDYLADLMIYHRDENGVELTDPICLRVTVRISAIEPLTEAEKAKAADEIDAIIKTFPLGTKEKPVTCKTNENIFICYNKKVIRVQQILAEVARQMSSYRNLGEYFFQFQVARIQEISIQTNLDVGPEADVERLLAEIYFEIDQFLAPYARRRSLSYMQEEKGLPNEEIFEGPALEHGFIDIEELQRIPSTMERKVIRTSDLVNLIMSLRNKASEVDDRLELPINRNIIAVSKLALSNYIENQIINEDITDCLTLVQDGQYLPRLSIGKSEITVFRDSEEVPYDTALVLSHFQLIKEQVLAEESVEGPFDLEVEKGNAFNFEDYYSIQEDFPLTYGIGEAGLAMNESTERKAQAKQFQGFLYFFEQLLANFSSQLSHIQDFFAISSDQAQSYFYQELYQLPGISYLLADARSTDGTWDTFINDPNNSYVQKLLSANESTDVFLDRRHRVLNHLMARFAENMEEYLLVRYSVGLRGAFDPLSPDYDAFNKHRQALSRRLIADKECFMQDYEEIGYERNKASNIQIGHTFDRLLILESTGDDISQYQWLWRDYEGLDRIHGFDDKQEVRYGDRQLAEDAAHKAIKLGTYTPPIDGNKIGYYRIHSDNGNPASYHYSIVDEEGKNLARSKRDFDSEEEAIADIQELAALLRDVWHTTNVSNLEKRLSRLLGLKRLGRHSLSTPHHLPTTPPAPDQYFWVRDVNPDPNQELYKLELLDEKGEVLLSSSKPGYKLADTESINFPYQDSKEIIAYALDEQNFGIDSNHLLTLKKSKNEVLASRQYASQEEAEAGLAKTLNFIFKHFSREGFHMIEHILLRPLDEDAEDPDPPFLYIPKKNTGEFVEDPYSFRITFILPTGCDRNFAQELATSQAKPDQPSLFQDNYWKQFVEKTIRKETPSHIYPEIFWLDVDQSPAQTADYLDSNSPLTPAERAIISLNHFEEVYKNWLETSATYDNQQGTQSAADRLAAKKELIQSLNRLYKNT